MNVVRIMFYLNVRWLAVDGVWLGESMYSMIIGVGKLEEGLGDALVGGVEAFLENALELQHE